MLLFLAIIIEWVNWLLILYFQFLQFLETRSANVISINILMKVRVSLCAIELSFLGDRNWLSGILVVLVPIHSRSPKTLYSIAHEPVLKVYILVFPYIMQRIASAELHHWRQLINDVTHLGGEGICQKVMLLHKPI